MEMTYYSLKTTVETMDETPVVKGRHICYTLKDTSFKSFNDFKFTTCLGLWQIIGVLGLFDLRNYMFLLTLVVFAFLYYVHQQTTLSIFRIV
jgi:hypothetical protein